MTAHNARKPRKPLNQKPPAPTGIVALKEAARRWLCVVLEHAGWIGRELGLCLSPSYRPDAFLADGYCKALRWRLRPTVPALGQIDMNALVGYGVKPISLMSALSRSGLGEDFPRATRWLWRLLDELPADAWTNGQPPTARLVGDWWKATDMLRGCLASTWAWMDDDFSDVKGLPEGIASILKRGGFPELSDDELAELGPWLRANASEVYHGLDRSDSARAPRMEEAKKCLWAIYECNTTLRRDVAPTVSQGSQQVPSSDEPSGAAPTQEPKPTEKELAEQGGKAKRAIATVKDRFAFADGQVFFDGKDLELPSGLPVDVLKKLHDSFGQTVAHRKLHSQSTCSEASQELKQAVLVIRRALKVNKIQAEIKSKRSVGYVLR